MVAMWLRNPRHPVTWVTLPFVLSPATAAVHYPVRLSPATAAVAPPVVLSPSTPASPTLRTGCTAVESKDEQPTVRPERNGSGVEG